MNIITLNVPKPAPHRHQFDIIRHINSYISNCDYLLPRIGFHEVSSSMSLADLYHMLYIVRQIKHHVDDESIVFKVFFASIASTTLCVKIYVNSHKTIQLMISPGEPPSETYKLYMDILNFIQK